MTDEKPVTLFGKNLADIPCFRDSYMYGICSGVGTGLIHFMFTSRPRISTHFGFGVFVVTTLSYWTYCRVNYSKQQQEVSLLKEFIKDQVIMEGTETDNKKDPILVGSV